MPDATPAPEPRDAVHDDDELASALAAQLLRFAPSGPIPIIRQEGEEPPAPRRADTGALGLEPTGPRFTAPAAPQPAGSEPADAPPISQLGPSEPSSTASTPTSPRNATESSNASSGDEPIAPAAPPAPSGRPVMSRPSIPGVPGVAPVVAAGAAAAAVPPTAAPSGAEPAPLPEPVAPPAAPLLGEGTALERAERLQAALSRIDLDEAAYREWEESLRGVSLGNSPTVAPQRDRTEDTAAAPLAAEVEAPDEATLTVAEAAPVSAGSVVRADDARAELAGSRGNDADDPAFDEQIEEPGDTQPATVTSSIDLPPLTDSEVPHDELVASTLPAEVTGDVVEAVILEPDSSDDDADGAGASTGDGQAEPVAVADTSDTSAPDDAFEEIDDAVVVEPVAPDAVAVTTGSIPISFDPSVIADERSRADTGSIPVLSGPIELDVDVDATDGVDDVAAPFEAVPGSAAAPLPVAPPEPGQHTGPIVPISTASLIGVPPVLPVPDEYEVDAEPEPEPRVEAIGIEPTPIDRRIGDVARMFWLWIAPNTSILTFALGAVVVGAGLSARQSIVAVLLGVVLACFPLALTTLAVKRSGQPTAIVSRASFGVVGNIVPTVLLLVVRLFWVAVLLWLLSVTTASLTFESGYDLFVEPRIAGVVALAVFGLGAGVVAVFGFRVLAALQAVLGILGVVVAGLVVALTAPLLDFANISGTTDGDWLGVLAGAITVFSLLGTAWAASGGDLARYQHPESSSGATIAMTSLGAALPSLLLIVWGVLLASSDEAVSVGLQTDPIATITGALPGWYPVPLLLALVISVLSGVAAIVYSGGLTLLATGVRARRSVASGIVAAVGILAAFGMLALLPSLTPVLLDLAPTLAVPVAAWGGIVAGEMLLRRRGFDASSLLRRGGVYADVRWSNLIALVVITVLGLGLISGTQGWFLFEGYLWRVLGVATDTGIGSADLGVLIALVLGVLTPIAFSVPTIRRQEAAEVDPAAAPHASRSESPATVAEGTAG
ncbi:hypothetical protein L3i23_16950 [Herbiconiux sp. L3-i23]|nr:hypothetical protein L3i23_16950 [Herbiconiux sp. L3-i23]